MISRDENRERRTIEAIQKIQGRHVRQATVHAGCRRLQLTLDNGDVLLLSVQVDEFGLPHLEADLLHSLAGLAEDVDLKSQRDVASDE
jgi:hypothetical protein